MSASPPVVPIIIRPSQRWLTFDWKGLYAYRDLLFLMVRRDFTTRYKQTVLGPLWFFIQPIVTTLIFTLVFNRVMGVSTGEIPPSLFYFTGLLGWNYFTGVFGGTSNSLAGNTRLFGKVFFPRLIPPLVVTASSLFALLIQLLTLAFLLFRHRLAQPESTIGEPTWLWLLFPLCVLHLAAIGLGAGLILSCLTAKYRDLRHAQGMIMQVLMYATPVIYPLSRIPEKWHVVTALNPLTPVVEATRIIFLGSGTFNPAAYGLSVALALALLAGGVLFYQRTARTFIDQA
jgi:lipopolysaccharide transport system permease protein